MQLSLFESIEGFAASDLSMLLDATRDVWIDDSLPVGIAGMMVSGRLLDR